MKRSIPQIPILDPQLMKVLTALKENAELTNGQRTNTIAPLASTATLTQVIAKVNEILGNLQ